MFDRAPIHCILPPHILKEIATRGRTPQVRARAIDTLTSSERLRGRREALSSILPGLRAHTEGAPSAAAPNLVRRVHTAANGTTLPGTLVRSEGQPAGNDVAVNEAYDGAGATYELYLKAYQRNSIDDRGMPIVSTVHYDNAYDNAFWNGEQMVYGDGDGELFQRFTIALDVIGHELTHGVTQYEANLLYSHQPGALNESMSDVFGSLVKQLSLGQRADQADWLIGAGLFTSQVEGDALRSMKAPGTAYDDDVLGKDPQPATMSGYVNTSFDNGGVHINSGIPNHAFYLAATAIGGNAWEKAGLIWYTALRDRLRRTADFSKAATETSRVAADLFGRDGTEHRAVTKAWADVGVPVQDGGKPKHAASTAPGARR